MTVNKSIGRRQQRKGEIKSAIIEVAHGMFEARGFDDVTVAEIAKKSDVSVKTLFTYFDTKEDLVFDQEMSLINSLIDSLKNRRKGVSAFRDFRDSIKALLEKKGAHSSLAQLEGFERMTDNAVLKSRLQLMWLKYENSLCDYLVTETSAKQDDPRPRLAAIQLIGLLRILTTAEARECAKQRKEQDALQNWFANAAKFVQQSLNEYAIKG